MTKDEALKLALEALENYKSFIDDAHIIEGQYHWLDGSSEAITAAKDALAQPDYRAVKTYHEGKPVYVSQTEFPPECKTEAEQTAYAFGWWKALEAQPRNFCPRCGKRTADLTVIHTCTPPEGGRQ